MSFFSVSKYFWIFTNPGNFLLLLITLGLFFQFFIRTKKVGLWLASIGAGSLAFILFFPVGSWLLAPLENRFSVPALPSEVSGIVILGGVTRNSVSSARNIPTLDSGAERLTKAVSLARQYPEARIVIAGGSGEIDPTGTPEAFIMREILIDLGIPSERISIDASSRNTYENAVFAKELANPKPEEKWLLITSAFHMPRAVGTFRKQNFEVIPYPVDFRTPSTHVRHLDIQLDRVGLAQKEWFGLVAYYMTDKTDALFSTPNTRRGSFNAGTE